MAQKYRSSAATRKNRKERRKKTLKGGKAGNQGIFHGARDALLWKHFPALLDLKGKPQTDADAFWRTLYAEYWSLFPWRLPLDKEPDAEGDWSEPSEMSEEMQAEKAMIIKRTQTVSNSPSNFPDIILLTIPSKSRTPCGTAGTRAFARTSILGRGFFLPCAIMIPSLRRAGYRPGSSTCPERQRRSAKCSQTVGVTPVSLTLRA